ncbi:MAG: putative glycoside hydrolase, partial [Candidatus Yonathbacteria bacterium]|nr:putative glycoside hydrolase [Candidatus Yonathbacteria bacterium]
DPVAGKAAALEDFFAYLHRKLSPTGVMLSADLFGMTMTNSDDLNIGQVLERAAPYFDFIAPMVYPSHYPKNFNGYDNPNKYPYEIIKFSMDKGVERLIAASSSPLKLRPWIQDFDYGGNYDIPEIQAQKKAVYDAGLTSWMIWDPSNRYTVGALDKE